MAQNLEVCSIADEVVEKLKRFRFRKTKTNAAIIMKINTTSIRIILDNYDDEELEDISIDDLKELLPAHQPRYIAYSYCLTHDDGRTSFPLCFIFYSPSGCKPEMQMMYAGSKLSLVNAGGFSKVFEIRSLDDLSEEWLVQKLKFFR